MDDKKDTPKRGFLSLVKGYNKYQQESPKDRPETIRVDLGEAKISDLADLLPPFVARIGEATEETRIFLNVQRSFRNLQDIREFRHVLGAFSNLIRIGQTELSRYMHETWFDVYELLNNVDEVKIDLDITYNTFGVGFSCDVIVFGDQKVCETEEVIDTRNEGVLHLILTQPRNAQNNHDI